MWSTPPLPRTFPPPTIRRVYNQTFDRKEPLSPPIKWASISQHPSKVDVTILLDESGSMSVSKEGMEGALMEYLQDIEQLDPRISLYGFDSEVERKFTDRSVTEAQPIVITPRGSTALYDAIVRVVDETGARLEALEEKPSTVLFIIITDGQENASRRYTGEDALARITHQTERYSWQFVYLGAGQDAIKVGQRLGIGAAHSMTYTAGDDKLKDRTLTGALSRYTVDTVEKGSTEFSVAERCSVIN
jgi:hypothetical protein